MCHRRGVLKPGGCPRPPARDAGGGSEPSGAAPQPPGSADCPSGPPSVLGPLSGDLATAQGAGRAMLAAPGPPRESRRRSPSAERARARLSEQRGGAGCRGRRGRSRGDTSPARGLAKGEESRARAPAAANASRGVVMATAGLHGHEGEDGAVRCFQRGGGRHLRMPFSTGRCHNHSTFPSSLLIPYRGHAGPYALSRASVGRKDAAGPARLRPRRRASAGASERVPADTERHRAHFQRSVPRREPHSPRRAAGAARLSKVSSPGCHLPGPCSGRLLPAFQRRKTAGGAAGEALVPRQQGGARGGPATRRPEQGRGQRPSALSPARGRAPGTHPLVCRARPCGPQ